MCNRSRHSCWKSIFSVRKGKSLSPILFHPTKQFPSFSTTTEPYDTDKMAVEFLQQFNDHAFSVGQCVRDIDRFPRSVQISLIVRLVTIPIFGQENVDISGERNRGYNFNEFDGRRRVAFCFSCGSFCCGSWSSGEGAQSHSGCDASKYDGRLRTSRRFGDQLGRKIKRVNLFVAFVDLRSFISIL